MNFMTTNMFAPHIWGFKGNDAEMRVARAAGWTRPDVIWERLMVAANTSWLTEGGKARAIALFRCADLLARLFFASRDLRRATAAANLAIAMRDAGQSGQADRLLRRALGIWDFAPGAVNAMEILPRSRSSLFHLRMEALHRATYHGNLRTRIALIAGETRETLTQINGPDAVTHRHFSRWNGERPTVFDDTRKILGACLLIIDQRI